MRTANRSPRQTVLTLGGGLLLALMLSGCAALASNSAAPAVSTASATSVTVTLIPSIAATIAATSEPTLTPTAEPTPAPTAEPSATPTLTPTPAPTVKPTAKPTVKPTAKPTVKPTTAPVADPSVAATADPSVAPTADPTAAPTAPPVATYSLNLYNAAGVRYQNPDMAGCTAASTLMMLNFIASQSPSKGAGFSWSPTTSYAAQEGILTYERANMTMLLSSVGSDPHGWRNALNYYGWGSMSADVYQDHAYGSYASAANAAVHALAATGKPVAILGWAGGHAQILNGYTVTGADPATNASGFTIKTLYITDPLASDGYRNVAISSATWQSGSSHIAFRAYNQTDSPYVDPIDGQVGKTEWYGRWVLVLPVR